MKKLLLAITGSFCCLISFAQMDLGFGYTNQTPLGDMSGNISAAQGFHFQMGYRFPFAGKQLVASIETGNGRYGKQKVTQSFQNEDMSTAAEYPVNYINFASFNHLNIRYELVRNKNIIPYVQVLGGHQSLGTRVRINVYDENNRDDCAPLENEVTFRKGTMVAGYGAGLLMKLGARSKCSQQRGTSLNLSVTRIHGRKVEYVNVKQLEQPVTTGPPPDSKPLTMPFVNINTNRIHNHTVAQLYNSPLQQLQIKLGLLFEL
jgi:hypothetical protein